VAPNLNRKVVLYKLAISTDEYQYVLHNSRLPLPLSPSLGTR
jgi:hypothetical protein